MLTFSKSYETFKNKNNHNHLGARSNPICHHQADQQVRGDGGGRWTHIWLHPHYYNALLVTNHSSRLSILLARIGGPLQVMAPCCFILQNAYLCHSHTSSSLQMFLPVSHHSSKKRKQSFAVVVHGDDIWVISLFFAWLAERADAHRYCHTVQQ